MSIRFVTAMVCGGFLFAAGFTGCAGRKTSDLRAPTGTSELELLPPPPAEPPPEGYDFTRQPLVLPPEPIRVHPPSYPESALAAETACVARFLYHIETDGTARVVRFEWQELPPAEHTPVFEASIRDAVTDWEFKPAIKLVSKKMPDGSTKLLRQPVPKARRAVVRFRVDDGRGVVE